MDHTFRSQDCKSSVSFQVNEISVANGTKSLELSFRIESYGFVVELDEIWFYDDDFTSFALRVEKFTSGKGAILELKAFSDFCMTVRPADSQGHFVLKFLLDSPVHGNSASLSVHLETQSLLDMAEEIKRLATSDSK
jgi:hypothetical protein